MSIVVLGVTDDCYMRLGNVMKRSFFALIVLLPRVLFCELTPCCSDDFQRMGELIKGVTPLVLFINLEDRTDRFEHISALAKKMNVSVERVVACNGYDALRDNPQLVILLRDAYQHKILNRARCIACLMSHYKAICRGIASGAPAVLIVEDDVTLPENLAECCEAFKQALVDLENVNAGWDMLYLGGRVKSQPMVQPVGEHMVTKNLSRLQGAYGAYAILYSREGLKKVKSLLDRVTGMVIDSYVQCYGAADLEAKEVVLAQDVASLVSLPEGERRLFATRVRVDAKAKRLDFWDQLWIPLQRSGALKAYAVNPFFMGQLDDYSSLFMKVTKYDDIRLELGCYRY